MGISKIFVCYVPGLDSRRIDRSRTPYIHGLMNDYPSTRLRTLPDPELLPSLLTGVYPHEHRVWQVSLKGELEPSGWRRWIDRLPDLFTTTAQCLRHWRDITYDLPAIPPRRRRRFEQHRFKYGRREKRSDILNEIGGRPSVLQTIQGSSRYLFTKDFRELDGLETALPSGDHVLEILELYALDLLQHWNLDDPGLIDDSFRRVDRFVSTVHTRCRRLGVTFVLLVDHGQEQVRGSIDLRENLTKLGIPAEEYTFFMEVACARFWFHTDRARRAILEMLPTLGPVTILSRREMHRHNVCFEDDAFGEVYAYLDPGTIYFPHDFYQPLGNLFVGLTLRHQRCRLHDPRHRGNHGYLPDNPSEKGLILLLNDAYRAVREEAELIDFAPTLHHLIATPTPIFMKGSSAFREA